jgi:hypothetical protein
MNDSSTIITHDICYYDQVPRVGMKAKNFCSLSNPSIKVNKTHPKFELLQ